MSKILTKFTPALVARARLRRKLYTTFAEKLGFVYFGYVDQRGDEHRLLRGMTLSPTHRDDHYMIGNFHGYDTTIVERVDTIRQTGAADLEKSWLIMSVDLHSKRDLPHIFIGHADHSAAFYRHILTKFNKLQRLHPGSVSTYDPAFGAHFNVFTTPTYFVYVEQLFSGDLHRQLVTHFPQFSYEMIETTLYVYSEQAKPSDDLLSKMLQCSVWLATELDRRNQ